MGIEIVRLGSPRSSGEGVRLGTVRFPPRGIPKAELATRDFYDVWLPALAPSAPLVKQALGASDERSWARFERSFRAEMREPHARQLLDLLAALSHDTSLALGCYCADERRCHRSLLRALLEERGAAIVTGVSTAALSAT